MYYQLSERSLKRHLTKFYYNIMIGILNLRSNITAGVFFELNAALQTIFLISKSTNFGYFLIKYNLQYKVLLLLIRKNR